jgi:hypothetical protein
MPNAKQYARMRDIMVNNPELLIKEKERVNNAVKNKYKNDLEYQTKCKQYQKEYYNRRKEQLRISEIRDDHSIE